MQVTRNYTWLTVFSFCSVIWIVSQFVEPALENRTRGLLRPLRVMLVTSHDHSSEFKYQSKGILAMDPQRVLDVTPVLVTEMLVAGTEVPYPLESACHSVSALSEGRALSRSHPFQQF